MFNKNLGSCDIDEEMSQYTFPSSQSEIKTQETISEDFKISSEKEKLRRKNPKEIAFLEEQFAKDPSWSRKTVQLCKRKLKLRTDQVYKWGFDKKVALNKIKKNGANPLSNRELGLKTRKEIFMTEDLNSYVDDVISGFESELELVPLNNLWSEINQSKVSNFASKLYLKSTKSQKSPNSRSERTTVVPSTVKGKGDNSTVFLLDSNKNKGDCIFNFDEAQFIEDSNPNKERGDLNSNIAKNSFWNSLSLLDYQDSNFDILAVEEDPFGFF